MVTTTGRRSRRGPIASVALLTAVSSRAIAPLGESSESRYSLQSAPVAGGSGKAGVNVRRDRAYSSEKITPLKSQEVGRPSVSTTVSRSRNSLEEYAGRFGPPTYTSIQRAGWDRCKRWVTLPSADSTLAARATVARLVHDLLRLSRTARRR